MTKTTKSKKTPSQTEIVEKLCKELLEKLGIVSDVAVNENKDGESFDVTLNPTKERGLIIGKRGETINSIQYILAMMFKQESGEWKRINLDVDGWKEKQEDYLKSLAEKAAQKTLDSKTPQNLYNLNSSQRRTIHMYISDLKGVVSESVGEGRERYLVIKPSEK